MPIDHGQCTIRGTFMAEMRRETVHYERRNGLDRRSGTDRRLSNWHDATRLFPPTAHEALASRICLNAIRERLTPHELDMDPEGWRDLVDDIYVLIRNLDEHLRSVY